MSCPNCGAEKVKDEESKTVYKCGSRMHEGRPGTFVKAYGCVKVTEQEVAMYKEQLRREKYEKGTNFNMYKAQATSIGDSESWCDLGVKVNGLFVSIKDKSYILIEACESGEGWLEYIEVDPKTVECIE